MDRLQAKAKEAAERLKKAADDISSTAAAAMANKAGGAGGGGEGGGGEGELAGSSSLQRSSPSPAFGGPSLADKYAALQRQYR
jgi:hypothetical protein